jgi:flavin reductase (DIM6/NTAB) family NADH-FMN oxidoreductase RutF
MLDVLKNAACFAVNILSDAQEPLSRHFSGTGHGAPPPTQLRFEEGVGAPLIANALATLTCSMAETFAGGDHIICIGRVIDFRMGAEDAKPLIFFKGRYHHLLAPDPISHPAPEPWLSDSVSIYNEAWPDPLRRVLAGEHDLP